MRQDIQEAYYCLEYDYNVSGVLQERPSNMRRNMSTGYQLTRMGFKPRRDLSFYNLTFEGKRIYLQLVLKWGIQPPTVFNNVTLEYDHNVLIEGTHNGLQVGDTVTYRQNVGTVMGFSRNTLYAYIYHYNHGIGMHVVNTACSMIDGTWRMPYLFDQIVNKVEEI